MKKLFVTLFLVCAVFTAQFFGIGLDLPTANAADLTGSVHIIDSLYITDPSMPPESDGPFVGDVEKDAMFRLNYVFSIPKVGEDGNPAPGFVGGDEIWLDLPDEITFYEGFVSLSTKIYEEGTGLHLFTATMYADKTIKIVFTDYCAAQVIRNFTGEFYFEMLFNESEIGDTNPVEIEFDRGIPGNPYGEFVNFVQDPPPEATVRKSGSYNDTTQEITWTIRANEENLELGSNVQVTDIITEGHELVPGSLTLTSGGTTNNVLYSYDAGTRQLQYISATDITEEFTLTYRTTVPDSTLLAGSGDSVVITNSATMTSSLGTKNSNIASVSIAIGDAIDKTGTLINKNQIDWTVVVNPDEYSLTNVTITDVLPQWVNIDTATVTYNSAPANPASISVTVIDDKENIVFSLGDITGQITIEFSTTIDDNLYLSQENTDIINTAEISADQDIGNNSDSHEITGVDNDLVRKTATNIDLVNGIISWQVVVNHTEVTVYDMEIRDEIGIDLEYIDDTFKVYNSSSTLIYTDDTDNPTTTSYTDVLDPDEEATGYSGVLEYSFGDISSEYTIEFDTQIVDPYIYKRNGNTNMYNTCTFTGTNVVDGGGSSRGSGGVNSNVISKSCRGYNYDTKTFLWRIRLDNNDTTLPNIIVEDYVREGQALVADSAYIVYTNSGASANDLGGTFEYATYASPQDNPRQSTSWQVTGHMRYTVPAGTVVDETLDIFFETTLVDTEFLEQNGSETIRNRAYLWHDETSTWIRDDGTITVQSNVVGKDGTYNVGDTYIDWEILVNKNEIEIPNPVLTDELEEGLYMDTSSLKVYNVDVDSSFNHTVGDIIAESQYTYSYDVNDRILHFEFNNTITTAYLLKFRTYIEDKSKAPFSNTAKFILTGTDETDDDNDIDARYFDAGGFASGDMGKIVITKVRADDNSIPIEGVTFELYDSAGNTLDTQTTGADGTIEFDFIIFDNEYTYKEVSCPNLYTIDDPEPRPAQIKFENVVADDEETRIFRDTFTDSLILASIKTLVVTEDGPTLAGVTYELFSTSDVTTPISRATTGDDGLLIFNNVAPDDYIIKEYSVPTPWKTDTPSAVVHIPGGVAQTFPTTPDTIVYYVQYGQVVVNVHSDHPIESGTFNVGIVDQNNNVVDGFIYDNKKKDITFTEPYGDYYAYIIENVENYEGTSTTKTLDETNGIIYLDIYVTRVKGRVVVNVHSDHEIETGAFEVGIFDKNDVVVDSFVYEHGKKDYTYVEPFGKYYAGILRNNLGYGGISITAELDEVNGIIYLDITVVRNPETGDKPSAYNYFIAGLIILLFAVCSCAYAYVWFRRKPKLEK